MSGPQKKLVFLTPLKNFRKKKIVLEINSLIKLKTAQKSTKIKIGVSKQEEITLHQ